MGVADGPLPVRSPDDIKAMEARCGICCPGPGCAGGEAIRNSPGAARHDAVVAGFNEVDGKGTNSPGHFAVASKRRSWRWARPQPVGDARELCAVRTGPDGIGLARPDAGYIAPEARTSPVIRRVVDGFCRTVRSAWGRLPG
jgi:hypothetical protein